ncbi:hypothetical protein AHF37_06753 [Paragonimus kellicotti]|nr:hypothetical protein AHF37_06753 [Paragonimus kellicotti]
MIVFPVIIVLLALFSNASAQNGTPPRKLTSTFKGILYYDLRLVEHPENLTKENKTKAQTDVCKQLTYMVPWYRPQRNISNCTIVRTDRNWISVNYTISVTEEFLQTNDPQCSTYYILLANLHITLENGNSGQPASPSSEDNGSTTIGVDGLVKKSSGWVRRAGFYLSNTVKTGSTRQRQKTDRGIP